MIHDIVYLCQLQDHGHQVPAAALVLIFHLSLAYHSVLLRWAILWVLRESSHWSYPPG